MMNMRVLDCVKGTAVLLLSARCLCLTILDSRKQRYRVKSVFVFSIQPQSQTIGNTLHKEKEVGFKA